MISIYKRSLSHAKGRKRIFFSVATTAAAAAKLLQDESMLARRVHVPLKEVLGSERVKACKLQLAWQFRTQFLLSVETLSDLAAPHPGADRNAPHDLARVPAGPCY